MISTRVRFCPGYDVLDIVSDIDLPQVHAMVGYTLMMAGVTRIIEVSFIVPKYLPLTEEGPANDNHSEHTLTDASATPLWQAAKAFRHLPAFVSSSNVLGSRLDTF